MPDRHPSNERDRRKETEDAICPDGVAPCVEAGKPAQITFDEFASRDLDESAGKEQDLSDETVSAILRAYLMTWKNGLFHDIGQGAVPEDVIPNPGWLYDREYLTNQINDFLERKK